MHPVPGNVARGVEQVVTVCERPDTERQLLAGVQVLGVLPDLFVPDPQAEHEPTGERSGRSRRVEFLDALDAWMPDPASIGDVVEDGHRDRGGVRNHVLPVDHVVQREVRGNQRLLDPRCPHHVDE